jgi:hypothetical protein
MSMSQIEITSPLKYYFSIIAVVSSLCAILFICAHVNDFIFDETAPHDDAKFWAGVLLGYVIIMMSIRLLSMELLRVTYELLWACNVAMFVAAYGLYSGRPHMVSTAAICVSIDQVMWYIDISGFMITYLTHTYKRKRLNQVGAVVVEEEEGKGGGGIWLIGVAKYLVWPETTWSRRITSIHHLWFMPLCMYLVGIPVKSCTMTQLNSYSLSNDELRWLQLLKSYASTFLLEFGLSCLLVFTMAIAARLFTPFHAKFDPKSQQVVYLNVNLAYEVWPDVTISIIQYRSPYAHIHLPRLTLIWSSLNLGCAIVLATISTLVGSSAGVLASTSCPTI